ncbi:MAG: 16S rRNA (cytidine(1402)-2'-O)-methyltransferase [Clostridia bacterium]|nr:16S rRNA (cytidine(1402)-2'-O)-methyltransferase [Clostridia bacterium]
MPKLYVVATPIGNLNDLSPRMRDALERADLIAAEDTRVTMKLLEHFGLRRPLTSCHRHNEEGKAPGIVQRMLDEDLTVALTCDAGTPGISDPGQALVAACWEAGIPVEPVCGPSAVTTALSAAGFDARVFSFHGFLPREKKPLREKLEEIRDQGIPVFVVYESPHRIAELTEVMAEALPGCRLCVCSDLSKRFEKIYRGSAGEVRDQLKANPNVEKGEYCVVAELPAVRADPGEAGTARLSCRLFLADLMLDGRTASDAKAAAKEAGYPRNEIYRAMLEIDRWIRGQTDDGE